MNSPVSDWDESSQSATLVLESVVCVLLDKIFVFPTQPLAFIVEIVIILDQALAFVRHIKDHSLQLSRFSSLS